MNASFLANASDMISEIGGAGMAKKTVRDIDVAKKRLLVRVDFNVPMDRNGKISDDTRIRACLPTIEYLVKHQARVILCSHLDRPGGKVVEELRLAPAARRLSELLNKPVKALNDCIGPQVEAAVSGLRDGDIILLENLRFHREEEGNDPKFAQSLSRLADIYVDDAFGSCHRAHASIVGVAQYLPAVSGFLLQKELETLTGLALNPARPFAAVIGGAKLATKLGLLNNMINKVNSLLIGGGMAATFLKSQGYSVGGSVVENSQIEGVRDAVKKAKSAGVELVLPQDFLVAERLEPGAATRVVPMDKVPEGWVIADIGHKAVEAFSGVLEKCKTVFWNGPVGVFEIAEFAEGTRSLARVLANLKATTIIGGGSTAEAVEELGLTDRMSYVSTGGGASLELLQGEVLPGVAVLQDK
jgi:phosphoglycerate kinase